MLLNLSYKLIYLFFIYSFTYILLFKTGALVTQAGLDLTV